MHLPAPHVRQHAAVIEEFHLGQVYRRLGLRSRTELAALLQREAGAPVAG